MQQKLSCMRRGFSCMLMAEAFVGTFWNNVSYLRKSINKQPSRFHCLLALWMGKSHWGNKEQSTLSGFKACSEVTWANFYKVKGDRGGWSEILSIFLVVVHKNEIIITSSEHCCIHSCAQSYAEGETSCAWWKDSSQAWPVFLKCLAHTAFCLNSAHLLASSKEYTCKPWDLIWGFVAACLSHVQDMCTPSLDTLLHETDIAQGEDWPPWSHHASMTTLWIMSEQGLYVNFQKCLSKVASPITKVLCNCRDISRFPFYWNSPQNICYAFYLFQNRTMWIILLLSPMYYMMDIPIIFKSAALMCVLTFKLSRKHI